MEKPFRVPLVATLRSTWPPERVTAAAAGVRGGVETASGQVLWEVVAASGQVLWRWFWDVLIAAAVAEVEKVGREF